MVCTSFWVLSYFKLICCASPMMSCFCCCKSENCWNISSLSPMTYECVLYINIHIERPISVDEHLLRVYTFSKSVCSTCCWVSNWSFSDSSSLLCLAISSCWLEEEALCATSWSQLARALFLSDDSLSCSCWRRERSLDHSSFSFVRDLHGGYCYAKCIVMMWQDYM